MQQRNKIKNQTIVNLNTFEAGDEKKFLTQDTRIIINDPSTASSHPFNCIGKTVSYFKINKQNATKIVSSFGTGTLIAQRVILTSAHNFIYKHDQNIVKAFKSVFYPIAQLKQGEQTWEGIPIKTFDIHPSYLDFNNKFKQRHDIILALLEKSKIIRQNQFLKINWNYSYLQNCQHKIMVAGYSEDHQSNDQQQKRSNNLLSYSFLAPVDQKQNFLYYKHTTYAGNSGGPVLFRKSQKEQYQIIAIHKGDVFTSNYGLLINSTPNPKQIVDDLVENSKLQKYLAKDWLHSNHKILNENIKLRQQKQDLEETIELLLLQNSQQKKQKQILIKRIKDLEDYIKKKQNFQTVQVQQNKQLPSKQKQNKYLPFLQPSKVIKSKEQINFIVNCFSNKKIKSIFLLYRASQNQFSVKAFRQLCDQIPHTLILCQNQFGKTFGGYTPLIWKQEFQKYGNGNYKFAKQGKSFIFSLSNKQKLNIISDKNQQQYQIRCRQDHGPIFGQYDIIISDNSNINKTSYALIGQTYVHKNYTREDGQSKKRFSGVEGGIFKMKQWQVWGIQFE